jgi:penicillin-binding protein 2
MLQALHGGTPPLSAYPSADRSRIEEQQRRLDLRDIRPGRTADRA